MTLTYSLEELTSIAQEILSNAKSNILAFYGEMGVGKTTLIKELCNELGVTETTSSPTFSIVNQYIGKDDCTIYHFDCYRIKNSEEILDIGFEDYIYEGDWIFIEWPEKIFDHLPENTMNLHLSTSGVASRVIYSK